MSKKEQYEEINRSKEHLEEILGNSVVSFAYPFGQLIDYTMETVSIVRELGFSCACSALQGFIHVDVDCYQLSRKAIRNWTGNEFERKIKMILE